MSLFRAAEQVKPVVKTQSGAKVLKQPANLKPYQSANTEADQPEWRFNCKQEENQIKAEELGNVGK